MILSFSTTACPKATLPEALQIASEAGFDHIELFRTWTRSSPAHDDTTLPMVRDRLAEARFTLSGLNIRNITGKQPGSDARNLSYNLRQIDWDIRLAQALGLNAVNTKGGARTDEALEDLIAGANTLLDRFPDLTINLGNHNGNRLQGIDDYQTVMPQLPKRARVLVDTGHLLSAGEDVVVFAEAFADRIGLVHLRDQRGETPVPFGAGELPFEALLNILANAAYDGILVIELEKVTWAEPAEACAAARHYVETLLSA